MERNGLTRRQVLKTGAATAAFAASSRVLTPRKSVAAREQKLVFWLQPNFNPTADRLLEEQTMAFAKEARLKDSEVQILKVPGGELAPSSPPPSRSERPPMSRV